jgi:acetyl-CoA acyltransferase
MSTGRDVAIVGTGMTEFGYTPARDLRSLAHEAVGAALIDAGLTPRDVECVYLGYCLDLNGQRCIPGQVALRGLGIDRVPITRIESACSSGSLAIHEAYRAVASGRVEVALAVGLEKMSGASAEATRQAMSGGADAELEGAFGLTFPGVFGMAARRHMARYGTTLEQITAVPVKARRVAAANPRAQFKHPVTADEILGSRMVADPLRLLHCCPLSDGCAAVVVTTAARARQLTSAPVWIRGVAQVSGDFSTPGDLTSFPETTRAARLACDEAAIPIDDVNLFEVHDCFAIAEIMHYEDLGLCERGAGGFLAASGETAPDGKRPVNASGGLLGKGHPLGASGVAQVVELVEQLRGQAGSRQVSGARVGLAHCIGGFTLGTPASVAVTLVSR